MGTPDGPGGASPVKLSSPCVADEDAEALADALRSGWLGCGPRAASFERAVAAFLGCRDFVALSSGTKSLEVALRTHGLEAGDEVLIPTLTFASAVHVVLKLGGLPVFVDSRPDDLTMCPEDLEGRLTPRSRFVMPMHFRGRSADLESITAVAARAGLTVVEDAAHAFGSRRHGRPVGSGSRAACFSFGPLKNLTCGEGGGIATSSEELAERLRSYRNLGMARSTWSRFQSQPVAPAAELRRELEVVGDGDRCHLPDLNAALGLSQLRRIETFREAKRRILAAYESALGHLDGIQLLTTDPAEDFLYVYAVRVPRGRDGLMEALFRNGCHTTVHYPPCHEQPRFRAYARGRLPVAEEAGRTLVSLPFHAGLTPAEVGRVVSVVRGYLASPAG